MSIPKNYTDHALILRTQPLGEADRIIIMLTRNNGIIHAVAKSIRKPNSKFGARLEPYMHTNLSLTHGRGTIQTISQATTLHAYTAPIMSNYNAYTTAAVIAETAETITANMPPQETHPYYTLAHGALAALANGQHQPHRILASYLTRTMSLTGWPLTNPTHTHTTEHPTTPLNTHETAYLKALNSGDWKTIDQTPTQLSQHALNLILNTTQYHLEKPLKTVALLEPEPETHTPKTPINPE